VTPDFAPWQIAGRNDWTPSDNGLLTANFDPANLGASSSALPAGVLQLFKLPIRTALTLSNLLSIIGTLGVGASTGSFAGVYSAAGVLLMGSADIGALLLAAGNTTFPLSGPVGVQPPFVWAALLANLATTQPVLWTATSSTNNKANIGLTSATARVGAVGAGLTALPASFVPSSINQGSGLTFFLGAS
jgi:hypothetical protein